jgi:SAM-dependent methyltransferase
MHGPELHRPTAIMRITSRAVRLILKRVVRLLACYLPPRDRHCPACNGRLRFYLAFRGGSSKIPVFFRGLSMVGSDVDNFECPACGATDRDRHLLLYLRASGLLEKVSGCRVVHFAAEPAIETEVRALGPASYLRCDLYPRDSQSQQVDITRMPFADSSVDLLIANHVLEHVEDDVCALREIHRVLRPGGLAILQTPYSEVLTDTWEDRGIVDPQARFHAFGQEDHVRVYGRNIATRFSTTGLVSRIRSHSELLPDIDCRSAGVNPGEPFLLFQRPGGIDEETLARQSVASRVDHLYAQRAG